ncbi:MAG: hypothetical protein LJE58_16760 [Thiogranum sp.]|jgi:ATP/maltotriose-dependent transcriptional regulator MalT/DNA-binding SARP family transcriptional activator|nr:hypothetical protein [Thiogranum sp.]
MSIPAPAKLSAPHLSGIYSRRRLFTLLDKARQSPAVWLSAPAGSGKTTLVASYLHIRKVPYLWYRVNESDTDIASFFYYLGLAARKLTPESPTSLPLFTSEYLAGLPAFSRNFFREFYSPIKRPFVVAFDNYQDAGDETLLHQVVVYGLSEVPPGITVMIISRAQPPPPLAHLEVSGDLVGIDAAELRLTENEAVKIGRLRGKSGNRETFKRLHRQAHGWAAGFILLLEQVDSTASVESVDRRSDPAVVFDYFAREVFRCTDPRTRQLLMLTALLPRADAETAQALTGMQEAGAMLEDLARRNYFTTRHTSIATEYEYHPLFRAFLLTQLEQTSTAAELIALRRRAAQLLQDHGEYAAAAALLVEAGDWENGLPIVLEYASELVKQGRARSVFQWIDACPESLRNNAPWLWYWHGKCRLSTAPAAARQSLARAYALMKQHDDLEGQIMSWCRLVESCIYEWRDLALLDEWLDEIQELDDGVANRLSDRAARHFICAVFSALLFRRPQDPSLKGRAERVNTLVMTDEDTSLRFSIGPTLLMYYTWFVGYLNRAGLVFDTLRPIAEQPDAPPLVQTTWGYMSAGYSWVVGAFQDTLDYAERGLRIAEEFGVHAWDILTIMQALCAAILLEDRTLADGYLEAMRVRLDERRTLDTATFHHMAAWHYLAFNDVARAHEHAKLAVAFTARGGFLNYELYTAAMLARTYAGSGKHGQAATLLEETLKRSWEANAYPVVFLCLLARSELAAAEGREEEANESLRQALKLAAQQQLVASTWTPSALRPLFVRALEHGIEVDYVRFAIRKLNVIPDEAGMLLESWPWPLKVYTLGRFSLVRDDAPLEFPARARGKVLDTFKALIALGGRDVAQTQLAEVLWPDADGDAALHNLETTLMRLRRLLGLDEAIRVHDRHVSLDKRHCWVDVWTFERLAGRLCTATAEFTDADVIRTEKILSLYHGMFLGADGQQSWAAAMAARLQSKFQRCVHRLGDHYQQQSDWDAAISRYQRALEIDPLDEPCYRRLMRCYACQGESAQAVATYRRCRQILGTTLGIMPSARTQSLFRDLTANHQVPPL